MESKLARGKGRHITLWIFISVFTFISLISNYQARAQSHITLKGTVLDDKINEPLSFATVTIPQSKISVVTNESGQFQFHIPIELNNSTIHISYLGYKTIKLKVSEIMPNEMTTFRMVAQEQQLKEVEIKEKKSKTPAEEIVKRAIRNIKKNYPKEKTLYYGYYRDYISPAWTVSY